MPPKSINIRWTLPSPKRRISSEKLLEGIKAEKAKQLTTKTKNKTKSQPQSPAQLALPLE